MTSFVDRADLGFFPLQDHAADKTHVPVSMRAGLAGGRLTKFQDPTATGSAFESIQEYGRDAGMGTLGDIHPWMFWQTRERSVRGCGAWAQVFGSMVIRSDTRYGVTATQPIRDHDWKNDTRFRQKGLSWPKGFQQLAKGQLLIALPGTEESQQHDLGFWADPRLFAPHVGGPGDCGTLVVDMQSDATPCMDNSDKPGIGGRHARLQTLMRVIAMPKSAITGGTLGGTGNFLALNYSTTQQEGMNGFGAIFAPVVSGGAVTPRSGPTGAITPRGGNNGYTPGDVTRNALGESNIGAGAFGAGEADGAIDSGHDGEQTPNSFGEFAASPRGGHGVALMAASIGYGPIHAGAAADKHQHGHDRDGNPINAAHISTGAFFFRDRNFDGPLQFEGYYVYPPGWPLTSRTHLTWDGAYAHPFAGKMAMGMWRWWTEVPYMAPTDPPGTPTTPRGPRTVTPRGRTPTGPGGPHGPATPGGPGGPKPKPKPGPATPGGKKPPSTGGGKGPSGPTPPGGSGPGTGGGGRRGGPTGPGLPPGKPYRDPPPPIPPAVTPRGGKQLPKQPPTTTPGTPQTPGSGGAGPAAPVTPRDGLCTQTDRSDHVDPNDVHDERNTRATPASQAAAGDDTIVPESAGIYVGGPGGAGTQVTDPRIPMGRLSGRDPWTRERENVPGLVERVGGADRTSVGLYSIWHPLQEGFAALAFRPQLMIKGYPHFEHNPQLPAAMIHRDEALRPQVLTLRAWGAQSMSGDYSYVEKSMSSRARGGTGHGGVLFAPPRFELEDYYGINSAANVEDTTSARATRSVVLLAPGVSLGFGKPLATGALATGGVMLYQDVSVATRPLLIAQDSNEIVRLYRSGGVGVVTVTGNLSATGTTGGDVVEAGTKFTIGGSDGITQSISFADNSGATHAVDIVGGIITNWTVTP